jgi:hypothetical protein
LPKKIEIDLLLADLAFQFGNPLARLVNLAWLIFCLRWHDLFLLRPTLAAQPFWTAGSKMRSPIIQILAQNLQLPRQRADVLACHHSAHRRKLERSAKNP